MPRIVNAQQNEVRLWDNISGSELVLYYRQPTTTERQDYANMCLQRQGNKVKSNKAAARLKYGSKVLTGFRDGDFARQEGENIVPLASDKKSPNYCENWKEEIKTSSGDIVMLLAAHVFDAPAEIRDEEEEDVEGKVRADLEAIKKGLCTRSDEEECLEENGANLAWACSNCPKKKREDIMDYTLKLLRLHALASGGYPFRADDLTLEEWADLSIVNDVLNTHLTCPLMRNK